MYKRINVFVKLEIVADVPALVTSSKSLKKDDPIPTILKELDDKVADVVMSNGFEDNTLVSHRLSRRNGGWSIYTNYILVEDVVTVKLDIDVRASNHPSKPNLAERSAKRISALKDKVVPDLQEAFDTESDIGTDVLDVYYQERDWGVQYYIGKGNSYSEPITSLDKLLSILDNKIKKIVDKYS